MCVEFKILNKRLIQFTEEVPLKIFALLEDIIDTMFASKERKTILGLYLESFFRL